MERTRLLDLSFAQVQELLGGWGEPGFRARQVWQWLYGGLANEAREMANLPKELRARLEEETQIGLLAPVVELTSSDGYTQKFLFQLYDGQTIETVLMGYHNRRTVCISTQVGCAMACPFCATGQAGFARNLSAGEIVAQVLFAARRLALHAGPAKTPDSDSQRQVTNVVFMGMGEPFVNYVPTMRAAERLTDPTAFGLGARRITISTVGIVPGIEKLAEEPLQLNLAVSLHAPNDELRNRLVPINKRYPLGTLMDAVRNYQRKTRRRVTFEYALMSGVNDSQPMAIELAKLLRGLSSHVNLIPLNPTAGSPLRPTDKSTARLFRETLEGAGIPATIRIGRGLDINAGCGQLRETHADSRRQEPRRE